MPHCAALGPVCVESRLRALPPACRLCISTITDPLDACGCMAIDARPACYLSRCSILFSLPHLMQSCMSMQMASMQAYLSRCSLLVCLPHDLCANVLLLVRVRPKDVQRPGLAGGREGPRPRSCGFLKAVFDALLADEGAILCLHDGETAGLRRTKENTQVSVRVGAGV